MERLSVLQKKICMLGSFAVGKTSLVAQYVHSKFSEKYLTTIGVKVDRKVVQHEDESINLLLWDIHGDDEFQKVRGSYLRGMAGYFLVVDGTRSDTLEKAKYLHQLALDSVGEIPFVLLLNKCDIQDQWQLDSQELGRLVDEGWEIRRTSAKTGENVDESFHDLAAKILAKMK
jgi:small GTP-binding protein